MSRQEYLEIANFICRFGDKAVLSDYFDEIIAPALTSDLVRETRTTNFFFLDTAVRLLDGNDPKTRAIVGRLVKSTDLRREQIYDKAEKALKASPKSMPTAPSSVFALVLDSHRLLYVREQSDSPSIAQFETTSRSFIKSTHLNYINGLFAERAKSGNKVTRTALREEVPIPSVEVVPMFSSGTLETFIGYYKDLHVMRISLAETNNEVDNTEFFEQLRKSKDKTKSVSTTVEHRNHKGLDKAAVTEQLKPATQGNAKIKLDGIDENGDRLIGNNSNFNIRVPIASLGSQVAIAAKHMYDAFAELINRGVVTLGKQPPKQATAPQPAPAKTKAKKK